ncbi:MAG: hypothetical protein BRC22_00380 [Parcubacteria group bacterium QH_9_35_7]|nr:MAG: hypothetical protein BRC22_00380 [Parcubacteria group bacterium QH_9_35_7]
MRREDNEVQVKDPAVKELENKRSCVKSGCSKGCLFVILLVVGVLAISKFVTSPQLKEVKNVPSYFPQGVPVYEKDSIKKIAVSDQNKNTLFAQLSDVIPKFFLVTYSLSSEKIDVEKYFKIEKKVQNKDTIDKFFYLMNKPAKKKERKVVIEWKNLSAEPDFIYDFYSTELSKNDFEVNTSVNKKTKKQIGFSRGQIVGSLFIKDDPEIPGTTSLSLDIVIPPR